MLEFFNILLVVLVLAAICWVVDKIIHFIFTSAKVTATQKHILYAISIPVAIGLIFYALTFALGCSMGPCEGANDGQIFATLGIAILIFDIYKLVTAILWKILLAVRKPPQTQE